MKKLKLVVIVGPTASGKTALSLRLAKKFGGEIVSADSRQIYREMNIGTAKPPLDRPNRNRMKSNEKRTFGGNSVSFEKNSGVEHWLMDIKNPDEEYNLADFKKDAAAAIENIASRGKLPIVVGGTGLYVSALVDGWDLPNVKPDPRLRAKLERQSKKRGLPALFQKLVALDPEAAYIVDPNNPRRVIRALEIALFSGKPFSAQRKKTEPPYRTLKIGIMKPREVLCYSTAHRVEEMIRSGLVEEVRGLMKKYGTKPVAFDAIGYREIIDFLNGKLTLPEAIKLIKKNTWAYAKRQLTWFKKDKEIIWIENADEAERLARKFLF